MAPTRSSPVQPQATLESFQEELGRLVRQFEKNLTHYKSAAYDEASLRQEFLNPFFRALGWDVENKAGAIPQHREVEIESRTEIAGRQKRADYLFRTDRQDRFVCEAKKPAEDLNARYAFQAKRYAWNKGLILTLLTDFEELAVYVVGSKPHPDEANVGLWKTWRFQQYPLVAQELWDVFARVRVAEGSIDRLVEGLPRRPAPGKGKARQQWLFKPDRSRALDTDFLNFLDEARRELASDLIRHNVREDLLEGVRLNEAVQRILDRLLFLRICEDRDIDTGRPLAAILKSWREHADNPVPRKARQSEFLVKEDGPAFGGAGPAPQSLWRNVVAHFRALDRRPPSHIPFFNGNLFKEHFSEELEVSDEWIAGFLDDVGDEESPYLFSVMPVEILGTIYERFLGKVVRPKGRGVTIEEKPEVRKAGGVYYTPRYIVDYIVEQTVGKLLAERSPQESLKLRILDPACGSGSFLIRAFERCCEHWQTALTRDAALRKKHDAWVDPATGDVHLTTDLKRRILTANVYGVDIDPGAVEVTQLSLYLKMLEGENRTTLARERDLFGSDVALLPPLQDNIKCGNSLIASDFSLVAEDLVRVKAFDWPVQFAAIMKAGGFDAVVGNPPYIPIETMEDDERAYYPVAYPHLERKFDTGVIFILQALRLIKRSGLVGYISSITWETGENFARLRKYLFTERGLLEVTNLPFNTFADAYVDTGVYVLCGERASEYRIYCYPKKAKIESLREATPVRVHSDLVTGPDFRLVLDPVAQAILARALSSSDCKMLGDLTKSTQGLAADRFQRAGSPKSAEWYPFGEQAQAHRYDFVVESMTFAYMRDKPSLKQFYEAQPKVLIRRIINRQDRLEACYCDEQMVFKKDINPFVLTVPAPHAEFVLGVINSRLISYLYVRTSAIATKDDFRQTTLAELRRLPVPIPDLSHTDDCARHTRMVGLVKKMSQLVPKLRAAKSETERATLQNAVTATDQQIDALVYELYGLTPEEIALVEKG